MKNYLYILTPQHRVKQAKTVTEWADFFEDDQRRHVADTGNSMKPKGRRVSTIFLGINIALHAGQPVVFESMVFPEMQSYRVRNLQGSASATCSSSERVRRPAHLEKRPPRLEALPNRFDRGATMKTYDEAIACFHGTTPEETEAKGADLKGRYGDLLLQARASRHTRRILTGLIEAALDGHLGATDPLSVLSTVAMSAYAQGIIVGIEMERDDLGLTARSETKKEETP